MARTKKDNDGNEQQPLIPIYSLNYNGFLYEIVLSGSTHTFVRLGNNPKIITDKYTEYMSNVGYNLENSPDNPEFIYAPIVGQYVPQYGEETRNGTVLLPTEAKPLGDINVLIDDMQKFIYAYCDLPPDFIKVACYYVLLTYVYDALDHIPYLSFLGDTGTGKSRCRQVIGSLCYIPIFTTVGVSPAAAYRIIDKWHGTLLIDEADFRAAGEGDEMVRLLNCGFDKYSPRIVCDVNDPRKLVFNNPFCPKIISRRFAFADKALESRCITQIMTETIRQDIPQILPPDFWERALSFRNRLLTFRLQYWHKFKNPTYNLFADLPVEPRLKQAFTSIGLVLQEFPDLLFDLQKFLLNKQEVLLDERRSTVEGCLVRAYQELMQDFRYVDGTRPISSSELALQAGEIYGTEISPVDVGRKLKALGFDIFVKRVEGKIKKVVVLKPELKEILFIRYGLSDRKNSSEFRKVTDVTDKTDRSRGTIFGISDKIKDNFSTNPLDLTVTSVTSVTGLSDNPLQEKNAQNNQNLGINDVNKVSEQLVKSVRSQSHSEIVKDILPTTPTTFEELLNGAKVFGISEQELEIVLNALRKVGDVIEPRAGFYCKTQ